MLNAVGRSVPRKDGIGKATGQARYADDLRFPGMLHGRTIRSTIPCGTLNGVHLDFDPTGFTIVDYRDIPGRNIVALIDDDQPCLAERDDPPRRRADPAARARGPRGSARRSRRRSTNEAGEPVFDPERSPTAFKTIAIEKGDVDGRLRGRRPHRRREYRTGHQEQLYIEPNGVIAVPEDGGITVYGSLQCPYYVHRALRVAARARRDARARRADRDRRRLRRQGRIPVDDRRPRGAARAQVGPAGEDDLRPRRGHARDDQAASVDRPAPHRRDARRPARRDGHRRPPRRRRLRDAQRRWCCRAA